MVTAAYSAGPGRPPEPPLARCGGRRALTVSLTGAPAADADGTVGFVPNRRSRRAAAVIASAVTALLIAAVFAAYTAYQHVTPYLTPPGCQAGTGQQAVLLDTEQAGIAATIAGVAAREHLPEKAVTIAYATAMQESHMHNLHYGDRDSVGVFQQRPSQGWGTASELEDPVYAAMKFFAALVRVPGYEQMPVDKAAQAVQHSADGTAYGQYAPMAAAMAAAFTGASPRAVWCWYTPGQAAKADLSAALHAMAGAFGPRWGDGSVARSATAHSAESSRDTAVVRVRSGGWAVAAWFVTHAGTYGITRVRYDGYAWNAAAGSRGWQRDAGPGDGSILLD